MCPNAIGGLCTSYELVAQNKTKVAFCEKYLDVLSYLGLLMTTDYYRISISTDVVGIESAVALKNGCALGIALAIVSIRRISDLTVSCILILRPLYSGRV